MLQRALNEHERTNEVNVLQLRAGGTRALEPQRPYNVFCFAEDDWVLQAHVMLSSHEGIFLNTVMRRQTPQQTPSVTSRPALLCKCRSTTALP